MATDNTATTTTSDSTAMPGASEARLSVLFCCLGNICQEAGSPMAEGAFRHTVEELGCANRFARIDSCGTAAYHCGHPPDSRTMDTLRKNGVSLDHRARQIRADDFEAFDYILAMDAANLHALHQARPASSSRAQVMLFGNFDGAGRDEVVEDPYYGGIEGFARNFEQVVRFSRNFVQQVLLPADAASAQ